MAQTRITRLYGVSDAKVAPVTADAAGGITYGTLVDVPGIRAVTVSGALRALELRGDNGLLDADSYLESLRCQVEHAQISLDVLSTIAGGTIVDSGSTPNQVVKWRRKQSDSLPYFKFEAATPTGGATPARPIRATPTATTAA